MKIIVWKCFSRGSFFFPFHIYIMDRYHPDKNASNPEASELFKEVAYSYSILSDPEKRRQYDSTGFEVLLSSCLFMFLFYSAIWWDRKNCSMEINRNVSLKSAIWLWIVWFIQSLLILLVSNAKTEGKRKRSYMEK